MQQCLFDGQGSVVGLVSDPGTEVAKYRYDLWGKPTIATNPSGGAMPDNAYRYKGDYLDSSGFYKMGIRYYDPAQGRFTQQDIIDSIGDPTRGNRYAAFGDNPINNADPTGAFDFGDIADVVSTGLDVLGAAAELVPGVGTAVGAGLFAAGTAVGWAGTGYDCANDDDCDTSVAGSALGTVLGGAGLADSAALSVVSNVGSLTLDGAQLASDSEDW